jgi:hypothetical protein
LVYEEAATRKVPDDLNHGGSLVDKTTSLPKTNWLELEKNWKKLSDKLEESSTYWFLFNKSDVARRKVSALAGAQAACGEAALESHGGEEKENGIELCVCVFFRFFI